MADWVPIYPIDTKTQQINLLPLFTLSFPLLLLVLRRCSMAGGSTTMTLWAVRPARAAHSHRTPRRGPSRTCEVSGLKRPRRCVLRTALPARLLRWRVLRIVLIAGGTRSRCGHPLGAGQSLNRLGPTSSDLAPYRVCDLIRRQHTLLRSSKTTTVLQ
jgi:hypothetical protein